MRALDGLTGLNTCATWKGRQSTPDALRSLYFVTGKGPSGGGSAPSKVWDAWALYFLQERIQDGSPGDFESVFIKLGTVKQRKGLG